MRPTGRNDRPLALLAAAVLTIATLAPPATAEVAVRFQRLDGFAAPGTPAELNAVGVLQVGPRGARNGSPWLTFGGIPAPFAGLFNAAGSTGALIDPDAPSLGQAWPLLPANLKPPIPVTNLALYGYALDTETSPPTLIAAQAHLGRLAASGDPRGWDQAGEITPIQRHADMFSGTGLQGLDGTACYHPQRLTLDSGAVAAGNANPAQAILDVHATHGHDLPRSLRMTYSHNDPTSASPQNEFVDGLVPFLAKIRRGRPG